MADEIVGGVVVADAGKDTVVVETPGSASKITPDPSKQVATPDKKVEDDRNRGILADLQKERKARQEYERQVAAITAERDQERRRVQALAGVNPKSAEEADADEVRAKFGQLFPGLAKLTDADIEKLLSVANRADGLEEATNHHWQSHGRRMLGLVTDKVAEVLGGKLTDRQADRIRNDYVRAAEADPKFHARHDAGDPTLVDEFVKEWTEDWFEPARRKAEAAGLERQRRVPGGKDRSIVGTGDKKIDVNDPKAVEDLLVAGFRERGGQFGR